MISRMEEGYKTNTTFFMNKISHIASLENHITNYWGNANTGTGIF